MLDFVRNFVKSEPAVIIGVIASVVVLLAGYFNILLDEATVKEALAPLVLGIVTRQFVQPVNRDPSPDPVDEEAAAEEPV